MAVVPVAPLVRLTEDQLYVIVPPSRSTEPLAVHVEVLPLLREDGVQLTVGALGARLVNVTLVDPAVLVPPCPSLAVTLVVPGVAL